MSVFTKQAFTMSAMPTPANSVPSSVAPSRRGSFANFATIPGPSGTLTPASEPHVILANFESVLFDMDGTLINSSPAVVEAWQLFSKSYTLDLDHILRSAHGMRTIDVLKKWCGITDPELLASEVIRFETCILDSAAAMAERTGKSGIEVLPGVKKLLDSLSEEKDKREGEEKWAICTSSTHFYAGRAIPIAGLTTPKIFVTADSVTRGKPFPDPYLLGAEGCHASPFESLVVEDAPTGIRAGKAAGCRVLATCTSHDRAALEKERPDFLVEDLSHVSASWDAESKTFALVIEQPVDRVEPRATPDATPVMTPAGSRMNSFSGDRSQMREGWKGSDELTGNDSVVGSPVPSRPGSPGAERKSAPEVDSKATQNMPQQIGVTLEGFKRALAGNARKPRRELEEED